MALIKPIYLLLLDVLPQLNVSSILEFHSWNPSPLTNWSSRGCAMGP